MRALLRILAAQGWADRGASYAPLALILAIAAFLRLRALDTVEFKFDEAWHFTTTLSLVRGEQLLLNGGLSYQGGFHSPLLDYIIAIPAVLNPSPVFVTGFIALTNVAAVALCYMLVAKYFGLGAAIASSTLFATSVWGVYYSRKIFDPNLLPIFTVLLFVILFAIVLDKERAALFFLVPIVSILVQIHESALLYLPLLVIMSVVFWRCFAIRPILLGCLIAFPLWIPYLYQQWMSGFSDVFRVVRLAPGLGPWDGMAFHRSLDLMADSAFNLRALVGVSFLEFWEGHKSFDWIKPYSEGLFLLSFLYLMARTIYSWANRRKWPDEWPRYFLVAVWYALPILLLSRRAFEFRLHYLVFLYPVQFVVVGVAIGDLAKALAGFRAGPKLLRQGLLMLSLGTLMPVIIIAGWQAYLTLALQTFFASGDTEGGHGVPLRYQQQFVERVEQLSLKGPVIVLSGKESRLALNALGKRRKALQFADPQNGLVYSPPGAGAATYALAVAEASPEDLERWGLIEFGEGPIFLPGRGKAFRFYALARRQGGEPQVVLGESVAFFGGRVSRPRARKSDNAIEVEVRWGAIGPVPTDYHVFVQMLGPDGKIVAQKDGPPVGGDYPASQWKPGDRIMDRRVLPVRDQSASGTYTIITGLYSLMSKDRLKVTWPPERVGEDRLTLGTIEVVE